MADNQVRLPSGSGGITRYFDESTSKMEYPPIVVVIVCIAVIVLVIILHIYGGGILG